MATLIDNLQQRAYGIEGLEAQYADAVALELQRQARLNGDVRAGGADDFRRRSDRIMRRIDRHYRDYPETSARLPRGGDAQVPSDVLKTAMNMLFKVETIVSLPADVSEGDQLQIGKILLDLAKNLPVRPAVIDAARAAQNDPQKLIGELQALVQRDRSVWTLGRN
ncbi:hypothetical protein [Xylophilus ampelinus]|nr:hypothetical protein [Xylophilus ampelinus]MCS4508832.1 hypothetical protein [Xylophilus ampelinus]